MRISSYTGLVALCIMSVAPVGATLIVIPAGQALGFTASTVISGLPQSGGVFGPFGLTLTGDNRLLVSDFASARRYVFDDIDGQTVGSAIFSTPSASSSEGYANVGGAAYGGNGSNFVQFNNNGTENHTIVPTLTPALGIAGNPVSGKLIATTSSGLREIDPIANTSRLITNAGGDGVSVSPDGTIAFVANGSFVTGYNIATGAIVFTSNAIPGGPDGTGVISSSNPLNGFIVVNANDGNVSLINPITKALTIIAANAGQRGDYVAPDFTNGTLLLDFTSEVSRLSCGAGCSIGAPVVPPSEIPSGIPEPGGLSLATIGIVGFGLWKKFKRNLHSE